MVGRRKSFDDIADVAHDRRTGSSGTGDAAVARRDRARAARGAFWSTPNFCRTPQLNPRGPLVVQAAPSGVSRKPADRIWEETSKCRPST